MRINASSADNSPLAPLERTPLIASPDTTSATPVCFAYVSNAAFKSPLGILKFSAWAAAANKTTHAPFTINRLEYFDIIIIPPARTCSFPVCRSARDYDRAVIFRDMKPEHLLRSVDQRLNVGRRK